MYKIHEYAYEADKKQNRTLGRRDSALEVPPGWKIASKEDFREYRIARLRWQSDYVVLADGSCIETACFEQRCREKRRDEESNRKQRASRNQLDWNGKKVKSSSSNGDVLLYRKKSRR
jgi:hypothetical protein